MFRPSQDSSVWLSLTSREQLMPPECSKHQVLINNIYKTCKYNKYVCIYLSCDLLINITHSHIKMQGNFFCSIFLQFWAFYWCLLPFWEEITWESWFYFRYTRFKEHISAFEKILSFWHLVILPLKHCICRKKFNFGWLYLLMPDRFKYLKNKKWWKGTVKRARIMNI